MLEIGKCILSDNTLSVLQAHEVRQDLRKLETTGEWDSPAWALKLGDYYNVGPAHLVVTQAAWRAVAEAYKNEIVPPAGESLSDQ